MSCIATSSIALDTDVSQSITYPLVVTAASYPSNTDILCSPSADQIGQGYIYSPTALDNLVPFLNFEANAALPIDSGIVFSLKVNSSSDTTFDPTKATTFDIPFTSDLFRYKQIGAAHVYQAHPLTQINVPGDKLVAVSISHNHSANLDFSLVIDLVGGVFANKTLKLDTISQVFMTSPGTGFVRPTTQYSQSYHFFTFGTNQGIQVSYIVQIPAANPTTLDFELYRDGAGEPRKLFNFNSVKPKRALGNDLYLYVINVNAAMPLPADRSPSFRCMLGGGYIRQAGSNTNSNYFADCFVNVYKGNVTGSVEITNALGIPPASPHPPQFAKKIAGSSISITPLDPLKPNGPFTDSIAISEGQSVIGVPCSEMYQLTGINYYIRTLWDFSSQNPPLTGFLPDKYWKIKLTVYSTTAAPRSYTYSLEDDATSSLTKVVNGFTLKHKDNPADIFIQAEILGDNVEYSGGPIDHVAQPQSLIYEITLVFTKVFPSK